jgi:prolyl oligopeptidase
MISYPKAKKIDTEEVRFGVRIQDPYRWMENEEDEDLHHWLEAQNQVTQKYFQETPMRESIRTRLRELYDYPKYNVFTVVGKKIIYGYNDGLQNQYVYFVQEGFDGEPEVLIDPNRLSEDGTTAITLNGHSKDKRYLAFLEAQSGSDWQTLKVIDLHEKKVLPDQLRWVKFTLVSWYRDGFFYSAYDAPEAGKEFTAKNENMKVYYHHLGEDQSQDQMVFSDALNPLRYHSAHVSEDERHLILISSEGTYGSEVRIKTTDVRDQTFQLLFKGFDYEYEYIGSEGETLYFRTDQDAPGKKIVKVNVSDLQVKDLIRETDNPMENAWKIGNKIVTLYLKDVVSQASIFDTNGNPEHEVRMPGIGSAYQFDGDKEMDRIIFSFGSFIAPLGFYTVNLSTGETQPFKVSSVPFDSSRFVTEQIFCPSKDGTPIPVFITRRKDCGPDKPHPALLYAYGGFNISLTPEFSPAVVFWLEQGGIYAYANLRGGGEYGEKWHKAGMLLNKQNVFDDFIAVAEHLIDRGYTTPQQLAIQGGSNGGLLMGAVTNQRPDLFAAVIAQVGVMDMLRYHTFTIGWGWATEYGNPDEEAHFKNILKYSPLHNIEEKEYPAVLVMTADHDDRVVPAHSFKYTATLQAKNKADRPVLLRLDQKAGHGMGKPVEKIIEESTDKFAFIASQICGLEDKD